MSEIILYNEDCFTTMTGMLSDSIDVVLTSPFYNTNKKQGGVKTVADCTTGKFPYLRYDTPIDVMTNTEYDEFTFELFNSYDRILKPNGVILCNLSYGNENTDGMITAVNRIITDTPFTVADIIVWKKRHAMPNNCSKNRLTRICEFVFVIVRKSELKTFNSNKKVKSVRATGQRSYENIYNFIEAKNNDGSCPYNKCTYSSELCEKLLSIYAPAGAIVYDSFMGSGTTAVACKRLNLDCIGSEISKQQCDFALARLEGVT